MLNITEIAYGSVTDTCLLSQFGKKYYPTPPLSPPQPECASIQEAKVFPAQHWQVNDRIIDNFAPWLDYSTSESHKIFVSPTHWLCQQCLRGASLRVLRKGLTTAVVVRGKTLSDGAVLLEERFSSTWRSVAAPSYEPRHPHVRDYGRWIVVAGDHAGKFVRGVTSKRQPSNIQWNVAVVHVRPGLADEDSGQRLLLDDTMMTLVEETSEEKKLNQAVKVGLRKISRYGTGARLKNMRSSGIPVPDVSEMECSNQTVTYRHIPLLSLATTRCFHNGTNLNEPEK